MQEILRLLVNSDCSPVCAEITREAFSFDSYKQIMGVLARRLQDEGENWRHVYKTLLLLEYMCKHGPQKVPFSLMPSD